MKKKMMYHVYDIIFIFFSYFFFVLSADRYTASVDINYLI